MFLIGVAALAIIAVACSKKRIDVVESQNGCTWLIVALTVGAIVILAASSVK